MRCGYNESIPAFLVLDGPDASGTTTHCKLLAERLRSEGHDVVLTSEPTDGPTGKEIRDYLKTGNVDPMELQMLFTKDREWHVENVITPALAAGKTVISDRYWFSTIIYAEAQGLDSTKLKFLNMKFPEPDGVIFTLPPVELSLSRIKKRAAKDFFEREEFQRKIHEGYARMAEGSPLIHVIDTSGEKSEVAEKIWGIVKNCLSP